MQAQDAFTRALASNHAWADKTCETQPDFFVTSAKSQAPSILWLGCADSRIPESTILDLPPGNVFVHRNIANIIADTDLSSLSVIEFAVKYLKVDHVVVCGHTECGGVIAALGNDALGVIDNWIRPLRRLRLKHAKELAGLEHKARTRRLAELNVLQSLTTLKGNPVILEAVKQRGLKLHGVFYDLAVGKLQEVAGGENEEEFRAMVECFDTASA